MDEENSILNSVKKLLGIPSNYTNFDTDIILHINSVFMTLTQLGLGPESGFSISDAVTTWSDFIPDEFNLHGVKTYMFLRVKLLFDPPLSTAVTECYKRQIEELEWRLNFEAEGGQDESK